MLGKMREGEVDDDKDMVDDVEGVQNQGGREMLSCFRGGISVFVVGMLMVMVGVIELMMVVIVVCFGVVEVDFLGLADTFVLGGDFVVVVVVEVGLVVGYVLKLVLWCSRGRGVLCDI